MVLVCVLSDSPLFQLMMMKGPYYLLLFPICLCIYLSVVKKEKRQAFSKFATLQNKGFCVLSLQVSKRADPWTRPEYL